MEYLYYPGCSQEHTCINYDTSARKVMEALGAPLKELEDWNCCGATNYISTNELMGFSIAARNLSRAQNQDYKEVIVTCSGCFTVFYKLNDYMNSKADIFEKVNEALGAAGLSYNGTVKARHLAEVIYNDFGIEKLKSKVSKPLTGLKVAPYSGCQLARPYGDFDSQEFPEKLGELMSLTGAEAVEFSNRARCCGGLLMSTKEEAAMKLCKDIFEEVTNLGADCIATICGLCQLNLEGYQKKINIRFGTSYNIPIVPFTQIIGLSLGLSEKDLMFEKNLVDSKKVLAKV